MSRARGYCFTINNYTAEEVDAVRATGSSPNTAYLVFGFEVGESGTPHIQGYAYFKSAVGRDTAKLRLGGNRVHVESQQGSFQQASDYCKKEGNFEEFGVLPAQGKRNDLIAFRDWVIAAQRRPTKREILLSEHVGTYGRCKKVCEEILDELSNRPDPDIELWEGWQTNLFDSIFDGENEVRDADPRKIVFVVDEQGNKGKSAFARYVYLTCRDKVQILRVGKRDDVAHAIRDSVRVFLFDVPRSEMQYFQYSIVEQLKDRFVFSPKYESGVKEFEKVPHVIVLCNELPDESKLSQDRYGYVFP